MVERLKTEPFYYRSFLDGISLNHEESKQQANSVLGDTKNLGYDLNFFATDKIAEQ